MDMPNWILKLFNDENRRLTEKELEEYREREHEEHIEREANREVVILHCEGNFNYSAEMYAGSVGVAFIQYRVDVSLANELSSIFLQGEVRLFKSNSELELYTAIANDIENGGKNYMDILKMNIVDKYKEHVENGRIDKIKRDLAKKKFEVNFSIQMKK